MTDVAVEVDFDIDLDHSPPCEVKLEYPARLCAATPTVARIHYHCPQCDNKEVFFICAKHFEDLKIGRQYCYMCGYQAVTGWKVI